MGKLNNKKDKNKTFDTTNNDDLEKSSKFITTSDYSNASSSS